MTPATQRLLNREKIEEPSALSGLSMNLHALTPYQLMTLRAMFWRPRYVESSNWLAQIPFIFWLIEAQSPKNVIELGTQDGISYFAFCQAIERLDLPANCLSIYASPEERTTNLDPDANYKKVKATNDSYYAGFSKVVRTSTETELRHIDDGAVDLLSINKFTNKLSARAEIDLWLPKLSDRGIILLNGINSACDSIHSTIYYQLKLEYPSFEFLHGDGLGILFIGNKQSSFIRTFLDSADQYTTCHLIREIFSHLGQACIDARNTIEQEKHTKLALEEAAKLKVDINDLKKALNQSHLRAAVEKNQFPTQNIPEVALKKALTELQDKARISESERSAMHAENLYLKRILEEKNKELATLAQIITAKRSNQSIPGSKQTERPDRFKQIKNSERKVKTENNSPAANPPPGFKEAEILRLINESKLFDREWYLEQNRDVALSNLDPLQHYLFFGADEGRNPSPSFDTQEYLKRHPGISELKINPLIHHILQTRLGKNSTS